MARRFRLTYPTSAVLIAIRAGHSYGFDLMDVTGLPDGTVYPILRRLEDKGVLTAEWESAAKASADRRPPRRYYRLTPEGVEAAEEALRRFPTLARVVEPGKEGAL